jgi:hypothetical protein
MRAGESLLSTPRVSLTNAPRQALEKGRVPEPARVRRHRTSARSSRNRGRRPRRAHRGTGGFSTLYPVASTNPCGGAQPCSSTRSSGRNRSRSSARPTIGRRLIASLDRIGFADKLFPLNPNYSSVLGHQCWPSIAALPDAPDVALFCMGHERVLDAFLAAVSGPQSGFAHRIFRGSFSTCRRIRPRRDQPPPTTIFVNHQDRGQFGCICRLHDGADDGVVCPVGRIGPWRPQGRGSVQPTRPTR